MRVSGKNQGCFSGPDPRRKNGEVLLVSTGVATIPEDKLRDWLKQPDRGSTSM